MASEARAKVTSVELLDNKDARWLNLVKINFTDQNGKARTWEGSRRPTRPAGSSVDAIQILAIVDGDPSGAGRPGPHILLEKQYRPPVDKIVVEFPAGLVDEGETPEQAALRELREETGFVGEIVAEEKRPIMYGSPASSSSATFMIKVRVDMSLPENQNPQSQLEDGEFIECFWVPLTSLYAELKKLDGLGHAIDGKLGAYAEALEFAMSSGLTR